MTNTLTKVKAFQFNALTCDIYSDGSEFFMTREQIGRALEYSNPMIAIGKIHERHAERLDQFSLTKLVNGRNTFLYSARGIYEICRWSRQPKVNAFHDHVNEVLESLRRAGIIKPTGDIEREALISKEALKLKGRLDHGTDHI